MKFTDGFWQTQTGVLPFFPAQVSSVKLSPDALTVYGPMKKQVQRGDVLNVALLTVRFSSPMADVIRVQIYHHKGGHPRKPEFEFHHDCTNQVEVTDNDQEATLTSGKLTVRIEKGEDWKVDYLSGEKIITGSGFQGMGIVKTPEGHFIHEQLNLGVGECVYGLGERFSAFVKNGQVIDIWNKDGGTSSEQAYKNIPFYLTNRGYGVFVNQPERVSFEVASEKVERVQFSVPGESLEYFLIYGPTPKEVLDKYTKLTGRPALPPAWSFGLWLSTSFTTDYDEKTVSSFIDGMAARDLPLHVFHFDCFWMKEFNWCDFKWDLDRFPDPQGMLKRLKERGLHICVWINPYIAQRSELFDEGMQAGYLLKKPNGDIWQTDMWQAGMGIVDFTNPAARQWFQDKLRELLDMGVDAFKTDFGERIPTDVVYFDGSDPMKMHNYYTYLYNKTVFDLLSDVRGEGEAVVFARSATTGGQQFPVHWGGDNLATFESMAESLRGGLSLGLSGFGFWSHDIGGFEQTAPEEVYKRWCAFGLLSSHSRLHGSDSYRVPWLFDEESVDVLRKFTKLKCSLMPYIYATSRQASQQGTPVLRAMFLEFPDDRGCEYLDRQYMFGDSLLVAPIFSGSGQVDYYVPEGRWTNYLTGKIVTGPAWARETHDFMSLPLMVRPNSIIPVGGRDDVPDYDFSEGVTLQCYELEDGKSSKVEIPSLEGEIETTFTVSRADKTIQITRLGSSKEWQVLLVGDQVVCSAKDAEIIQTSQGSLVKPGKDANELLIELK